MSKQALASPWSVAGSGGNLDICLALDDLDTALLLSRFEERWNRSFGIFSKIISLTLSDYFFFFFDLAYSRWTSSLPSCLWSLRILPTLPGSRLTVFYRDASSSAILQLATDG